MIKILEQVCKNIYDWKIPFAWNFRCRKRALTYLYLFNNKIWIKLNNWPLRHGKMVFWLQSENLYQEKLISCRDVKQKCSSFTKFHRKTKKNWGQIGVWQIGRCTVFAFILYKFSFNHYLEIVEIHEKSF